MKTEYEYAKQIVEYIWAKCYKQESPKWEALPDLMGVLSQIDNMVYGMSRPQPVQPDAREKYPCCDSAVLDGISEDGELIGDGFGTIWSRRCPGCGGNNIEVVRPGMAQCADCS